MMLAHRATIITVVVLKNSINRMDEKHCKADSLQCFFCTPEWVDFGIEQFYNQYYRNGGIVNA